MKWLYFGAGCVAVLGAWGLTWLSTAAQDLIRRHRAERFHRCELAASPLAFCDEHYPWEDEPTPIHDGLHFELWEREVADR